MIPLGGDELPMSTENLLRRANPRQIPQTPKSQNFPRQCQPTPLVVVQENPLLPQQLFQDPVLGPQILDGRLLVPIDPARQEDHQKLPRLQDETHGKSIIVEGICCDDWKETPTEVEFPCAVLRNVRCCDRNAKSMLPADYTDAFGLIEFSMLESSSMPISIQRRASVYGTEGMVVLMDDLRVMLVEGRPRPKSDWRKGF